jgi:two-component system phosphate regulon response regulator OmpR
MSDAVVLVVEDEASFVEALTIGLRREGFEVAVAVDGAEALERFDEINPDLVLLDVMLPKISGVDVCRQLRKRTQVPIIMVTAKGAEIDTVVGLEVGADDYVAKPFELRELLARVKGLLRRTGQAPRAEPGAAAPAVNGRAPAPAVPPAGAPAAGAAPPRVAFGTCTLDLDGRRLFDAGGAEVELTASELDLVMLFARNPGRALNRDQIMEGAHNRSWDVFDRSIDLRVMRLRRKVERNPEKPEAIRTVRGVGYVFVPGGAPP